MTLITQPELDLLASREDDVSTSQNPGNKFQRERLVMLCDRCCSQVEGDIVEIGAYTGATSQLLATIARKYDRKLVCVDNWNEGPWELHKAGDEFKKDMQKFSDVLVTIRADAHAPETIKFLQQRRYAFVFCDDGHSFAEHLTELRTLLPFADGLVVVDDMYLWEVSSAVDAAMKEFPGWGVLKNLRLCEAYLERR